MGSRRRARRGSNESTSEREDVRAALQFHHYPWYFSSLPLLAFARKTILRGQTGYMHAVPSIVGRSRRRAPCQFPSRARLSRVSVVSSVFAPP